MKLRSGAVYSPDGKRILSWSRQDAEALGHGDGGAIGEPLRHEARIGAHLLAGRQAHPVVV